MYKFLVWFFESDRLDCERPEIGKLRLGGKGEYDRLDEETMSMVFVPDSWSGRNWRKSGNDLSRSWCRDFYGEFGLVVLEWSSYISGIVKLQGP